MPDIVALLQCLQPHISVTTMRQWSRIITAMLCMSGRVTMLGISRWAGIGGSYRTVYRFFHTVLPWATLFWIFFRKHLFCPTDAYLLAGDEVVITKSGKQTHGIERFFSSLYDKSISGLSFFTLSLVSIEQRRSFPICIEQTIKTEEEKRKKIVESSAQPVEKPKGGRPKGSKTKSKTAVTLTEEAGEQGAGGRGRRVY